MKSYWNAHVKCPYFRRTGLRRVCCEWMARGEITQVFDKYEDMEAQLIKYCSTFEYRACPIATLNERRFKAMSEKEHRERNKRILSYERRQNLKDDRDFEKEARIFEKSQNAEGRGPEGARGIYMKGSAPSRNKVGISDTNPGAQSGARACGENAGARSERASHMGDKRPAEDGRYYDRARLKKDMNPYSKATLRENKNSYEDTKSPKGKEALDREEIRKRGAKFIYEGEELGAPGCGYR